MERLRNRVRCRECGRLYQQIQSAHLLGPSCTGLTLQKYKAKHPTAAISGDAKKQAVREWVRKNSDKCVGYSIKFRAENKDLIAARTRDYRKRIGPQRRKEQGRRSQLKQKYGISHEDYLVLLKRQGGKCKVCRADKPSSHSRMENFAVDHCHNTGRIRGLLCDRCNRGIGLLGDSTEILTRALRYLEANAPRK